MCGRFTVAVPREDLFDEFGLTEAPFDIHPRYNVAPTQIAPVILRGKDGALRLEGFRWGLVPYWAKASDGGNRMINARAETLEQKPAFREAFQRHRCLIPADGWYEWQKQGTQKVPMWIHLRSRRPFAFAGLWERWRSGAGGEWLHTFTIVTTDAAPALRAIHDRMPVVLPRPLRDRWLAADAEPAELLSLVVPYAGDDLDAWPVSRLVNSPANDVAECVVEDRGEGRAGTTDGGSAGLRDGESPTSIQQGLW